MLKKLLTVKLVAIVMLAFIVLAVIAAIIFSKLATESLLVILVVAAGAAVMIHEHGKSLDYYLDMFDQEVQDEISKFTGKAPAPTSGIGSAETLPVKNIQTMGFIAPALPVGMPMPGPIIGTTNEKNQGISGSNAMGATVSDHTM